MLLVNFDIHSTEGLKMLNAACGCLGTSVTNLRMIKLGSLPNTVPTVAIPRQSKTVSRKSKLLDTLAQYNVVVRTQAQHSTPKQVRYTYTVTGFGIALLEQTFGVRLYLMAH